MHWPSAYVTIRQPLAVFDQQKLDRQQQLHDFLYILVAWRYTESTRQDRRFLWQNARTGRPQKRPISPTTQSPHHNSARSSRPSHRKLLKWGRNNRRGNGGPIPIPVKTVNLDGYKVQLQESRPEKSSSPSREDHWEMQIKFGTGTRDEMPSDAVREYIKSQKLDVVNKAGEEKQVQLLRWNDRDRAWGMQIDYEQPRVSREKAFEGIQRGREMRCGGKRRGAAGLSPLTSASPRDATPTERPQRQVDLNIGHSSLFYTSRKDKTMSDKPTTDKSRKP